MGDIDMEYHDVIVTTGDLKKEYEVVGPVYFQVSNKGIFSSALSKLSIEYEAEIAQMKQQGQIGQFRGDWGFLYGEFSVGQSDFEKAFFIAVQELKKRAKMLDADAIIAMRQDIDLDTNAFQFFYLQMYGTAVRMKQADTKPPPQQQPLQQQPPQQQPPQQQPPQQQPPPLLRPPPPIPPRQ
jgi:hypothetical protein